MSNTFTLSKRVFATIIATVTILSTVGFAAFTVPQTASAQTLGGNIMGSTLSTVYYYGYDGSRYTYPNEKTYDTWFDGFAGVETISDAALADISLAANVVYRPGSRWIKIDTANPTYAVARDGMIHWVETEAVAVDYAGDDWNTQIDDVPDVFFVDYTSGASLMTATAFDGMMYMDGTDYMLAWDGERRMVTDAGRAANDMEDRFFLDGAGIDDSALTDGSDVSGSECDLQDAAQTGCVDVTGGDLNVSLSSSTPASMSVPNSANSIEVATFKFTAGDAVQLDTLVVGLTGLSDTNAIGNNGVYLYENGARLTDGRTVNSSTRDATFAGLRLDFAAGQTRELSIVVDMDPTNTDGTFGFAIESVNDVLTNGTVTGSFPVEGNEHQIIDVAVGTVTIDKTGSFEDPTLGQDDATIAEFNLDVGSEESGLLSRITLEINDSKDHSDYQLYQGSTWLASGEDIGNDLVFFDLSSDPFFIQDGADRDFEVTADIGGDAGDTLTAHLDNIGDLLMIGNDFGFGMTVTRDGYDGGTLPGSEDSGNCAADGDDCSFSTLEGGEITIAFNGPPADDVKNGGDDVLFYEFTITAERYSEIQELEFDLTGTDLEDGTTAALTDVRLEDCSSGILIAGPEELSVTGGNAQSLLYTDNFFMDAGDTLNLCLSADIEDTVAAIDDTFLFTLDMSQFDIEDDNGDSITDIVPSSDLVGNTQTVEDATLTVSLASSPAGNTSYVKGQTGVLTTGFNMIAGTASDIEVTDATITVWVDEDNEGGFAAGGEDGSDGGTVLTTAQDRISSCSIYDGADDSFLDGPESPDATTGEMIFANFSWLVTAGNTGNLEVVCNLANVDPVTEDTFAFEIDTATDVEALDDEGDSVTPTGTANTAEEVTITVFDAGTLDLSAAADVPDAEFLITGSDDNLVSSFRFDASNEAARIDRITVSEEQGEADDTATVDSSQYANNVEMATISYMKEDGTMGEQSSALTGNAHTFELTSGQEIWVPKDDSTDVDILVDVSVSDRSSGSATSNERVRMGISTDTVADDEFRSRGVASNETLDDDDIDPDVAGANGDQEIWVVRETAPTITLSAATPSGAGFVPGDQEVLRFNVSAHSNEDVVLEQLLFDFDSSDNASAGATEWNFCDAAGVGTVEIAASDFDFYNLSQGGTSDALDVDADWTLYASDGTVCDPTAALGAGEKVEFVKVSLTDTETVPAGQTYTYSLYFDSTGADSAEDDSVQFLVDGDLVVDTFVATAGGDTLSAETDETVTTLTSSGTDALDGDLICVGSTTCTAEGATEVLLVVDGGGTSTLEVVRGYLGTAKADIAAAASINVIPGAMLWQDDGSEVLGAGDEAEQRYGAWLVDDLPLVGSNAMSF